MKRLPVAFWLIAPFATWMVLMAILPSDGFSYAVRTVVTAGLLALAIVNLGLFRGRLSLDSLLWGVGAGLVVLVIWVLPEQFDWAWYRKFFIVGEGGTSAIAEASAAILAGRLIGSAFVIAVAEELFFRRWLIDFAGFWGMVGLFAIEHDRWLVGALAGLIYGLIYLKKGLGASILAHITTNFMLGIWVLCTGQWHFW